MFIIDWPVIGQRLTRSRLVRRNQGHLKGKPRLVKRRYRAIETKVDMGRVGGELKVGKELATVCHVGNMQLKRENTHLKLDII